MYTKGPWEPTKLKGMITITIDAKNSGLPCGVATIWRSSMPIDNDEDPEPDPIQDANVRLIVAAPDLLEACKQALETLEFEGMGTGTADIIRAAIEKAEGE